MNNRRRRIEAAIDGAITFVVIIIMVVAVCFAGYVLSTIANERAAEMAESPTEEVVAPADIDAQVVIAQLVQCSTKLVEHTACAEMPLWEDCDTLAYIFTDAEVDALARLVCGEARNCNVEGQAGIIWCVLNRVDSDDPYFPDDVIGVVTQPNQFFGYRESDPVLPELAAVARDVLMRYCAERSGIEDVGRVLPREYVYFSGDGERNYFTTTYAGSDVWNWSLRSPYRDD